MIVVGFSPFWTPWVQTAMGTVAPPCQTTAPGWDRQSPPSRMATPDLGAPMMPGGLLLQHRSKMVKTRSWNTTAPMLWNNDHLMNRMIAADYSHQFHQWSIIISHYHPLPLFKPDHWQPGGSWTSIVRHSQSHGKSWVQSDSQHRADRFDGTIVFDCHEATDFSCPQWFSSFKFLAK